MGVTSTGHSRPPPPSPSSSQRSRWAPERDARLVLITTMLEGGVTSPRRRAGRHRGRHGCGQAPPSFVILVWWCSSVRGARVKLLVQFHRTGSSSLGSSSSAATSVPWPPRERRGRERERADLVCWVGRWEQATRAREREESGSKRATRACPVGPCGRWRGSRPAWMIFVFLFPKMWIVFSFIYFVANYLEFQK
jgi:hypothetical protein